MNRMRSLKISHEVAEGVLGDCGGLSIGKDNQGTEKKWQYGIGCQYLIKLFLTTERRG
jgi:hypothetical protein